jgi:hypothetical protein
MSAGAGAGCLGYERVPEVGKPRLRSGDQAQRLGCVDEVPLRGSPRVNPLLKHKVQGRTGPAATCRGNPFDLRVQDSPEVLAV